MVWIYYYSENDLKIRAEVINKISHQINKLNITEDKEKIVIRNNSVNNVSVTQAINLRDH